MIQGEPPDKEPEDIDFAAAMQGVKRQDEVPDSPAGKKPIAKARFSQADEDAVIHELLTDQQFDPDLENGEELLFTRPGLQHKVIRKLKRGQYRVESSLDLHGMNRDAASAALQDFLQISHASFYRCIKIIHGKGLRSRKEGPVLKKHVATWLSRRKDVLAFSSATPKDGGTGAMYVLLRKL